MNNEVAKHENTQKQTSNQSIKKTKSRKPEMWKKQRLKMERHSAKELPPLPDCGHCEKSMYCSKLTIEDVTHFQGGFYKNVNKVKQDIFILRHCSVSAPKRCRAKDGIQRKSMVVHYNATTIDGSLVPVCRKTFTHLLGIKYGRVQGVLNRYIQSKQVPTENRGGDRNSKKFQRKLQSICDFLESLQGTVSNCARCEAKRLILSPEYDMRKLWHYYNVNAPHDLRVVESYFRNVFTRRFNISFVMPKEKDSEKDHCYRCANPKKSSALPIKRESENSNNDDLDLKILEMSYPPGEHFLFAPIPSWREPIGVQKEWQSGDNLEYINGDDAQLENSTSQPRKSHRDKPITLHDNQTQPREPVYEETHHVEMQVPVLSNILQSVQYQSIQTQHPHLHHLLSLNNSHIQIPSTQHNQNMNLITTHQNMNMHHGHNYIIHSQQHVQIQQDSNVNGNNGHAYASILNSDGNSLHISNGGSNVEGHLNGILNHTNLALNSICNDTQCNVIHLENHYGSLHDTGDIDHQENGNHNSMSDPSGNDAMQQDYQILSLPSHNLNNQEEQKMVMQQIESSNNSSKASELKGLYKCMACRLTFSARSTYYIHKKRHTDSKLLECEHCERKFRRRDAFKQHLRTHTITKPHQCPECDQSFGHRINLDIHMSRHKKISRLENQEEKIKCQLCLKYFLSREDLDKHTEWHKIPLSQSSDGKKTNECDICHKTFASGQSLNVHKRLHTDGKSFICEVCNIDTVSLVELTQHMRTHAEERPHKCDICGLGHVTVEKKDAHLRSHEQDGPNQYECKICGKTYRSPVYLRRHTLTHSGERPFECGVCSRGFTRQYCLNRHLLHHSGAKPHQCGLCGKRLADLRTLNNHMNIHVEKKPFHCTICSAKFSFSSNLKEHLKKMHKLNDQKKSIVCDEMMNKDNLLEITPYKTITKLSKNNTLNQRLVDFEGQIVCNVLY